jgi:hypothetical protein
VKGVIHLPGHTRPRHVIQSIQSTISASGLMTIIILTTAPSMRPYLLPIPFRLIHQLHSIPAMPIPILLRVVPVEATPLVSGKRLSAAADGAAVLPRAMEICLARTTTSWENLRKMCTVDSALCKNLVKPRSTKGPTAWNIKPTNSNPHLNPFRCQNLRSIIHLGWDTRATRDTVDNQERYLGKGGIARTET